MFNLLDGLTTHVFGFLFLFITTIYLSLIASWYTIYVYMFKVGSTVTLVCNIFSGVVEVAWFKDDVKLDKWNSYYNLETKMVRTTLVLESVSMASQGKYDCAAGLVSQTADLWPVKHEIALYVVGATIQSVYSPLDHEVILTCIMPTPEMPDAVLWYKNGELLSEPNTILFDSLTTQMKSLYTIDTVAAGDYGLYKAFAYFDRLDVIHQYT